MGTPEWNPAMKELTEMKTEALRPVASAFRTNLDRTMASAAFPAELVYSTARDMVAIVNAVNCVKDAAPLDLDRVMFYYDFKKAELEPLIAEQLQKYATLRPIERASDVCSIGGGTVENRLKDSPGVRASIDALYASIVLESWLFFEAMASDLWAVGVDFGGVKIAARIAANNRWEKSEMLVSGIPDTISNAKTQPGSWRREVGQVSFVKMRSIKSYFEIAFGDDVGKLFDNTADGFIYALSAVRNAIAHCAGKADGSFKRSALRFPEFKDIPVGDPILLDGPLVGKLRNASLLTGVALLKAVDGILQRGD